MRKHSLLHGGELGELDEEVLAERAADAAVLHLHDLLLALDQVLVLDQAGVDVQLGHVVDEDGDLEALLLLQDILEQRGLAGAEEAGEEGDGDGLGAVLVARPPRAGGGGLGLGGSLVVHHLDGVSNRLGHVVVERLLSVSVIAELHLWLAITRGERAKSDAYKTAYSAFRRFRFRRDVTQLLSALFKEIKCRKTE